MYLQGYLIARPLPADRLMPMIAAVPEHMQSLLLTLQPAGPPAGNEETSSAYETSGRIAL
jgi:hypothetical protein